MVKQENEVVDYGKTMKRAFGIKSKKVLKQKNIGKRNVQF